MAINKESVPPPVIGKIGPYTVFMTPPSTPKPAEPPTPVFEPPKKAVPPPVQPPPQQFEKPPQNGSFLGFFKNAVNRVQDAHSSLDDHDWKRNVSKLKKFQASNRMCNLLKEETVLSLAVLELLLRTCC
ncbi:hypothetical protein NL676_036469 [Syzygium grande]|nr:hypothetical protein NL676_036469 [Syzygium grande]